MEWLKNAEPSIEDVLSDPIVLKVVASYGSSPEAVRSLLQNVARSRRVLASQASPAPQQPAPPAPGSPVATR